MSKIDLSDIKESELDKTVSFTDLMTRSERRQRKKKKEEELYNIGKENNEIKNENIENNSEHDADIKDEIKKIEKNEEKYEKEDNLLKTGVLELTRQMKFNIEDNIEEEKKKKGFNPITDIGIFILIALAYFIYSLLFTSYLDNPTFLIIDACIILFMFLLFGITIVTTKRNNRILEIINFIILIGFLSFNIINTIGILSKICS